jgi:hypothetical protein
MLTTQKCKEQNACKLRLKLRKCHICLDLNNKFENQRFILYSGAAGNITAKGNEVYG